MALPSYAVFPDHLFCFAPFAPGEWTETPPTRESCKVRNQILLRFGTPPGGNGRFVNFGDFVLENLTKSGLWLHFGKRPLRRKLIVYSYLQTTG